MIDRSYAPNDAPITPHDDRYTLEIQLTGIDDSKNKGMAQGVITLRAPDGTEHAFEFNSGGYGPHDETWIPGLTRTDCDLVHYDLDWDNMAVDIRGMDSGFTGRDGRGSWIALVSPRHFTDRGASRLGGSSSGSFGIHTDGSPEGTKGCIALSDKNAKSLFELLQNIPEEQRPLRLNVLPPQQNFTPPSVDPEIFQGLNLSQIGNISQMACETYLRTEFDRLSSLTPVNQGIHDEFSMTTNRAASLLFLDKPNGINQQTMLGIWDLNSDKGHPRNLSQGESNWGMTQTQFANALLHHGPEIEENVREFLKESDIQYEASDIRAYTVALRNYMADSTNMHISVPLDGSEADQYFEGLEVPSDMFTDPTKIAYISDENNYRRYHDKPLSGLNQAVGRLVESDKVTPEDDFVERFNLLRRLPFAEPSALSAELLSTAENIGIDPMNPRNAGHLYAAYQHGDTLGTSTETVSYQRHIDLEANKGISMALPFITNTLNEDVETSMRENSHANPYDRIQASFVDAGLYETMDIIRESVSTPILALPVKPLSFLDVSGIDVSDLPDINLKLPPFGAEDSVQPQQANFQL